jgi:regulator of protease activity HflC (stomatin/prohibitin superfamily)/DNA-directed RNA polymerase subunit RPC12/RpoP
MTQIETISFSCTCGKRLMARADQAGRTYACPGCGSPVNVPALQAPVPTPQAPQQEYLKAPTGSSFRKPGSIAELALWIFIAWSAVSFVCLITSYFGRIAALVSLSLFGVFTLLALHQGWTLLTARHRVLAEKDVPLLYGMVRLLAWDPTEGVLILRNKELDFADDDLHDGKGGVKLLYPMFGEELALRVPLEVQTLAFTDTNVLTREYLNLSIRATMKWRIENIRQFYLLVSRELRSTGEKTGEVEELAQTAKRHVKVSAQRMIVQLMNAAVDWLRGMAQEQTRIVVSRVRSGLLIADRLLVDVPEVRGVDALSAPAEFGGATDGLASAIHQTLAERLKDFGIAVVDVTLQEIKLPEEIVKQCVEAAKTAYVPLMSKRNATARQAELKVEVDLLGKEAVGARELIASAPAYALRDFLSEFIVKTAKPATDAVKPTIDLTQLESIEDQTTTSNALPNETKSE